MAVVVLTGGGVLAAQVWAPAYVVAVGVCLVSFVALFRATLRHPQLASLRHAAIGAGAAALIAVIVGLLLAFGTDLPLDVRVALRVVILAAATAPALYWLLLWLTGGFREAAE